MSDRDRKREPSTWDRLAGICYLVKTIKPRYYPCSPTQSTASAPLIERQVGKPKISKASIDIGTTNSGQGLFVPDLPDIYEFRKGRSECQTNAAKPQRNRQNVKGCTSRKEEQSAIDGCLTMWLVFQSHEKMLMGLRADAGNLLVHARAGSARRTLEGA